MRWVGQRDIGLDATTDTAYRDDATRLVGRPAGRAGWAAPYTSGTAFTKQGST
jgi:hypothetical protein